MALHIAVKKEEQVEVVIQPEIVSAPKTKEAELVDVLVSLWERYEAFDMKETTKQMEAVKKQLQEIANENYDSKEMVVLNGEKGQVVFSPRTEPVEVINSQELFHLLI
jgi:hypothetical protein